MDNIKAYADSRFRARDSNSDSDFQFEPLDLPDSTVCYVDDMSIPHTWRTVESHSKFYIIFKMEYLISGGTDMAVGYNYDPFVSTSPEGNYTGANLASGIQELLNGFAVTFGFEVFIILQEGLSPLKQIPKGWVLIMNSVYPVVLE